MYFTGDGARRDKDGYFWIMGRVDDVLNVSGHRLGTMEVESRAGRPPGGRRGRGHRPDRTRSRARPSPPSSPSRRATPAEGRLKDELKAHVASKIGALARPDDIRFAAELPKTRSGKIMRRLLRDVAEGRALGDTTTLADPTVVATLKNQYEDRES